MSVYVVQADDKAFHRRDAEYAKKSLFTTETQRHREGQFLDSALNFIFRGSTRMHADDRTFHRRDAECAEKSLFTTETQRHREARIENYFFSVSL